MQRFLVVMLNQRKTNEAQVPNVSQNFRGRNITNFVHSFRICMNRRRLGENIIGENSLKKMNIQNTGDLNQFRKVSTFSHGILPYGALIKQIIQISKHRQTGTTIHNAFPYKWCFENILLLFVQRNKSTTNSLVRSPLRGVNVSSL